MLKIGRFPEMCLLSHSIQQGTQRRKLTLPALCSHQCANIMPIKLYYKPRKPLFMSLIIQTSQDYFSAAWASRFRILISEGSCLLITAWRGCDSLMRNVLVGPTPSFETRCPPANTTTKNVNKVGEKPTAPPPASKLQSTINCVEVSEKYEQYQHEYPY